MIEYTPTPYGPVIEDLNSLPPIQQSTPGPSKPNRDFPWKILVLIILILALFGVGGYKLYYDYTNEKGWFKEKAIGPNITLHIPSGLPMMDPNPNWNDSYAMAICLSKKEAKIFCSDTTTSCKNQLAEFDASAVRLNYVDCSADADTKLICENEGITAWPTWEIGGQKVPGYISLKDLSSLTGCPE